MVGAAQGAPAGARIPQQLLQRSSTCVAAAARMRGGRVGAGRLCTHQQQQPHQHQQHLQQEQQQQLVLPAAAPGPNCAQLCPLWGPTCCQLAWSCATWVLRAALAASPGASLFYQSLRSSEGGPGCKRHGGHPAGQADHDRAGSSNRTSPLFS